ncbi:unnamed protein product (macronuclear) [Paramecium tetraurelia]|uniref:C2H2-type domain-containing protein n=1 Tax=Paramecium tetraurelia TaxID=5888 RepID=A0D399_PARTE|nr:uncharacterized protein GSPATT00013001001 [Paramecium tetraurelia]CAK77516.1 unnamed protein product [Paramecium tetraurelia]|eukprot:XP_001444913.1 hypothetical protein (macronuclear) [Paramecium tetraurelia strain d4-2]
MLPKFQNSFAQDKNLQTLIESFNQSQKNPNALQRSRYLTYMPSGSIRPPPNSTQTLNILQEKVTFTLLTNPSINSTLTNDQQDIILKFQIGNRNLQIVTLDKITRDQKEEEQNQNPYIVSDANQIDIPILQQQQQQQQQQKQKIDFKLEDADEIEVNGNDNILTISTKSIIKYNKIEQYKKPVQNLHQEIQNKNEAQMIQIHFKFVRDWYTKAGNNQFNAKKALQEFLKSLAIPKIKILAFDQQQSLPEAIPDPEKKPEKNEKPEEKEPEEEHEQKSEKDLQNLFPHVTEEFVQRQREALEKKNQTTDEKIKRLFEEVRIRHFKSQPYNAEKNIFKCPYHKCQKVYKKPNQLKNHLKTNHQKLSEIGLTIDDNGEYKYNERILDYCLLLWKVYPNFVKSVINEMRQRKDQSST